MVAMDVPQCQRQWRDRYRLVCLDSDMKLGGEQTPEHGWLLS